MESVTERTCWSKPCQSFHLRKKSPAVRTVCRRSHAAGRGASTFRALSPVANSKKLKRKNKKFRWNDDDAVMEAATLMAVVELEEQIESMSTAWQRQGGWCPHGDSASDVESALYYAVCSLSCCVMVARRTVPRACFQEDVGDTPSDRAASWRLR